MSKPTLIALLLLTGCATTSGVVPAGPDTYMISGQGAGAWVSGGDVVADLYRQANAHCAAMHKQLVPVTSNSLDSAPLRFPQGQLHFRCLSPGDPELQRPFMAPTPNIRIEQK